MSPLSAQEAGDAKAPAAKESVTKSAREASSPDKTTSEQRLFDEDAREAAVVARFVSVLGQNPRRGTALDKVYAFHVERGSLDSFLAAQRERTTHDRDAASAWLIVGLVESLRGDEEAAIKAFEQAELLTPDNALASFYLGQTLVQAGEPDKAIAALERAIARSVGTGERTIATVARADLLDMFQTLGRLHQRAAHNDKALDVWNRLEQQFPNDERVQEQIATTLLEVEAFEAALPRYEKLAESVKDKSRQLAYRMESADIRVKIGQTEVALKEFERLLGQLNPEHWVYREVRRRIEAAFLRTENRTGLATYYETWLAKHPEDLDAIARAAKVYATLGRDEAACEWLERGVTLAPSSKELRRALIDRRMEAGQIPAALAHFEQLDRTEPNNSDTLRDWGRAILKDRSREVSARREAAAAVWRKLSKMKPQDALVASQIGDFFRQAEMNDEAIEQYRRAITLAPEATQYREYLGEFFHSLKRSDEALETWRQMATGDMRTTANVGRLAEVLAGFGYVEAAITNYAEACRLDPKDLGRHLKHIDLLARAERHDEALKQLDIVENLIATDEEHEAWLSRDLRSLAAAGKLKERIEAAAVGWALRPVRSVSPPASNDNGNGETQSRTGKSSLPTAEKWYWLARAYEVGAQRHLAAQAVLKASELAPRSIPILRASARILEARRDLTAAAEVTTKLVTLDRRYRTEYLKQLATLERQLGHRDQALQAGRDLIAAAPGNLESAEFFAQLCFQLNAVDEGLSALRRSIRANSTDPLALVRLASALIERQRAGEAIDLLWRAFEKSQKLDDRLLVVQKLVEAHAAMNQQPRLIERLQRLQNDRSQRREMTLCLAQAYQAIGNTALAQQELESLLSDESRDPVLLAQLRQLAEKRQEWTAAANYQREVWQLTQDKRDRFLLAGLLMKVDQIEEAIELLVGDDSSKELTAEALQLLDGLYETGQSDVLLARLKPLRDRFPDNWELLYREGVALAKSNPEEAAQRFETLLSLNLNHDEPALGASSSPAGRAADTVTSMQLPERMSKIAMIKQVTSFEQTAVRARPTTFLPTRPPAASGNSATSGSAPVRQQSQIQTQTRYRSISPHDYGEGRVAAMGWLVSFAKRAKQMEGITQRVEQLDKAATPSALADLYAIHRFLGADANAEKVARKLAQHSDANLPEKSLYLQALAQRHQPKQRTMSRGQLIVEQANVSPLYSEEVDEVLAIYHELEQHGGTASTTQLSLVITELNLSGRATEVNTLLREAIERAMTEVQLNLVMMTIHGVGNSNGTRPANLETATLTKFLDREIQLRREAAALHMTIAPPLTFVVSASGTARMRANFGFVYHPLLIQQHLQQHPDLSDGEVLGLWSRYVKLEALRFAERMKQPEGRSNAANQVVAGQSGSTGISQLALGTVFGDSNSILLTAVWSHFYRNGKVPPEFFAAFETAARSADLPLAERILWTSALGHVRWINTETEAALAAWAEAAALAPDVVELQINLAKLYERAGQTKRAVELAAAIQPVSNEWLVERDQLIVRQALASGNLELAKIAAQRLSTLKLNPQEVLLLAEQMLKLDMEDQAESLLSQSIRPADNTKLTGGATANTRSTATSIQRLSDLRAQRILLDIQLKRGRMEAAAQTAVELFKLLETTDPRSLSSQQRVITSTNGQSYLVMTVNGQQVTQVVSGSVPELPTINVPEYRQHVLNALHKTGKLAAMTDEVEAKLKKLPLNEAYIATLKEYHTVAGNEERLQQLDVLFLEVEQNRPDRRFSSIVNLLNQERHPEAVTQATLLIERNPDYFASRCRDLLFRFQSKRELRKLAKVFEKLDWSRYDKYPEVLPTVIEFLSNEIESEDIAKSLFVTAWESQPGQRLELLLRCPDERWWKLPQVSDGLRGGAIPINAAELANQWSSFGRIIRKPDSISNSAGKSEETTLITTAMIRLLTMEAERDRMHTFAASVERGQKQFPDWTAGKVLLALIDLRRESVATGRDSLRALLPELKEPMRKSPLIAWEIAQELARHDESLDVAVSFYEMALNARGIEAWTSSSSPVHGIIQSLKEKGRRADARRILLNLLPMDVRRGGDLTRLPTAIDLNVAQWIGRELRGIGYSIDAIHTYQGALERTEGKSYSNGGHDPRVDLRSSLVIAFKELQPAALIEYFAVTRDAPPQLDPQLFVTESTTPSVRLRSRWQPLVDEIAKSPELAARMTTLLNEVRQQHPDDFITLWLAALLARTSNDNPAFAASVERLIQFVERTPLVEPNSETAAVGQQREAARNQIGAWLVARKCLSDARLKPTGMKLAERALRAARLQTDKTFAEAIATEWLAQARESGDTATVERLERELEPSAGTTSGP